MGGESSSSGPTAAIEGLLAPPRTLEDWQQQVSRALESKQVGCLAAPGSACCHLRQAIAAESVLPQLPQPIAAHACSLHIAQFCRGHAPPGAGPVPYSLPLPSSHTALLPFEESSAGLCFIPCPDCGLREPAPAAVAAQQPGPPPHPCRTVSAATGSGPRSACAHTSAGLSEAAVWLHGAGCSHTWDGQAQSLLL